MASMLLAGSFLLSSAGRLADRHERTSWERERERFPQSLLRHLRQNFVGDALQPRQSLLDFLAATVTRIWR